MLESDAVLVPDIGELVAASQSPEPRSRPLGSVASQGEVGPEACTLIADAGAALRGPVDRLLDHVAMLRSGDALTLGQQAAMHREIGRLGEQVAELIDDFLDLAQIEAGVAGLEPGPVSLPALFDHLAACERSALADHEVVLVTDIDEAVPSVLRVDAARLGSLLTMLIEGAIETDLAGRIGLEASMRAGAPSRVAVVVRGGALGADVERLLLAGRIAGLLGASLEVPEPGVVRLTLPPDATGA